MNFCNLLLTLATGAMLLGTSAGLKCWICSSALDPKCGDDKFNGETTPTIQKQDCSQVPSPSSTFAGAVTRTVPATACMKIKLDIQGLSILTRTCASPGDYGVQDARHEGCTTLRTGTGEAYTCLCTGDYCNGAVTQTLATILVVIPLIKIFLNSI